MQNTGMQKWKPYIAVMRKYNMASSMPLFYGNVRSAALFPRILSSPNRCPKCGAPREQFKQLSDQEAQFIVMSRKTNYLHMKALTLLRELLSVAGEIARDNLDPICVKIVSEEKSLL